MGWLREGSERRWDSRPLLLLMVIMTFTADAGSHSWLCWMRANEDLLRLHPHRVPQRAPVRLIIGATVACEGRVAVCGIF